MLFVYGTLRDPDILAALLGSAVQHLRQIEAAAPDYRAVYYPGRVYPALIAAPGGSAPGIVLEGLADRDVVLLDHFEGAEYRRQTISVTAAGRAQAVSAYLPTIAIDASAPAWTLDAWTKQHKHIALTQEQGLASALRKALGMDD